MIPVVGHRLGELSWTEVRDAAEQDRVVLLPIGAIEQHGPHLPVHEDSIVAEWVADRVALETGALVAPGLHYGHSPFFRGFPGNLSLSEQTLRVVTYELLAALVASGLRRIVVVNNNGGNVAPVAAAAYDARRDLGVLVGQVYPWQLGYELMRDCYPDPDRVFGHGAEPEHSAMLAMFPDQVRPDPTPAAGMTAFQGWTPTGYTTAAVPGYDVGGTVFWDFAEICADGVTGDVRAASLELGRTWVDRVVGFCVEFVREYERNTRRSTGPRSTHDPVGE